MAAMPPQPMTADSTADEPPAAVPAHASLRELPDDELLVRCRDFARESPDRAEAVEVLVRRYTPLVRAIARPYLSSPEPSDDLMQVGFVGLLKAINHYDPAFGNGLKAYAAPCISGELKRHFRDKRWQVRVARPVQELLLEMRGAIEQLTHELGRRPEDSELATRLGVTPDDLREARQAAEGFSALSLDAPAGGGEDAADLGQLLGGDDAAIEQAEDMEAVFSHWEQLPRREQRILVMRFYGNLTQEEVAGQLGISQMHVSRLQARALTRLRDWLNDPEEATEDDASRGRSRTA
jgi:RNA polymerase sigma-B factor